MNKVDKVVLDWIKRHKLLAAIAVFSVTMGVLESNGFLRGSIETDPAPTAAQVAAGEKELKASKFCKSWLDEQIHNAVAWSHEVNPEYDYASCMFSQTGSQTWENQVVRLQRQRR